ncbi:hypothetical protein BDA99DRAFT_495415 [Phascolomyces articulosus]|uniref:Uncharacterized protein n=1 Tax=Phascolomyces articulosus TaxID=60185 RepID=A0AAD5KPF3_9FUNG|nr:hypothetical protein BDA99DRAFT_495415 [Phascolomyces articulosus]
MTLASFILINQRWKPSRLIDYDYENYRQLRRFMAKDIFEARLKILNQLILKEFPHVWIDTYLFTLAMILVIVTAVFAVIAVELTIVTWYPLCILVIPAIIACWNARRRGLYSIKLNKFHEKLDECLKNFTIMDTQHYHVRWSYRLANDIDRRNNESFDYIRNNSTQFNNGKYHQAAILVIEIFPTIDTPGGVDNTHQQQQQGRRHHGSDGTSDVLPIYSSVTQDIVLDMGPPPHPHYHQPMEEYSSSTLAFPPPTYRSHPTSTQSFSQRSAASSS